MNQPSLELALQDTELKDMCLQELQALHLHKINIYNNSYGYNRIKVEQEFELLNKYITEKITNPVYFK